MCLLIKIVSDLSSSNKDLTIYDNDTSKLEIIDKEDFNTQILNVQKANDMRFMVKNLPIKLNELAFGSSIFSSTELNLENKKRQYLCRLLDSEELIKVHNNIIINTNFDGAANFFSARKIYDESLDRGFFKISKNMEIEELLISNDIMLTSSLSAREINRNKKIDRTVISFSTFQDKILESKKCLFEKNNALLLFLSVNGFIRVVNC